MVFDAAAGYSLLFGGCASWGGLYDSHACLALGDTWTLTNGTWTNITGLVGSSPPPRADAGMVYDPDLGSVILFGGFDGSTVYNDTWSFSQGLWTRLTPPSPLPAARFSPAMAYDVVDHEVVLFGGADQAGDRSFNDTWTFADGTWSNISGPVAPAPRFSAVMSYDAADGFVLLFSGWSTAQSGSFSDTWKFVGGAWSQLALSSSPPPRNYAGMAYDGALNASVVTGGHRMATVYNDSWAYNLTDGWQPTGTGPAATGLWGFSVSYDPTTQILWRFGGADVNVSVYNQTWAFGPPFSVTARASPQDGAVPLVVSFRAGATGGLPPYSYSWTFGDGSPASNSQSPSHTYSTPGSYTAVVSVKEADGNTQLGSFSITVVAPLTVSTRQNQTALTLGQSVQLEVTPSAGWAPYSFFWAGLPQGCTGGNQSTVVCTPTVAGDFTPTVSVTDALGERVTATFHFTVTGPPSAGGPSLLWVIALGVVVIAVVAAGLVVYLRSRRRRSPQRPGAPPPAGPQDGTPPP